MGVVLEGLDRPSFRAAVRVSEAMKFCGVVLTANKPGHRGHRGRRGRDLLCDLRDLCVLCVPALKSLLRATSHTILVRARLILVPSHCDMARRFLSPSIGTGTFAVPPTFPTFGSLLALNFRCFYTDGGLNATSYRSEVGHRGIARRSKHHLQQCVRRRYH